MSAILVIDDESSLLRLMEQVLTRFGHQVKTAASGMDGLKLFREADFDLVITDVRMPGMDGDVVADQIREEKVRPPILGMSGTPWLLEEARFDAVLEKPFPIEDLMEKVDGLIDRSLTDPAA